MSAADTTRLAEQVFTGVLAPLVLGGPLRPGDPIGGKAALPLLEGDHPTSDPDRRAHVELGRVRRARPLCPVDRFDGIDGPSWLLGAAVHDLLLTVHPELARPLQGDNPRKLLAVVEGTLAAIPPCATPGEALARHTIFARLLEVARTDRHIRWWTGKASFLGRPVPSRLAAWPELRRVQVDEQRHPLIALPSHGASVPADAFRDALANALTCTPLTDFATLDRALADDAPPFRLGPAHRALLTTRAGRTLALRAEPPSKSAAFDRVLGRAVRLLAHGPKGLGAASPSIAYLGERVLRRAQLELQAESPRPLTLPSDADALVAITWGAAWAQLELGLHGGDYPDTERRALLGLLGPLAAHGSAAEIRKGLQDSIAREA